MQQGSPESYRVFVRTWWANDPTWPGGLRPQPGRQRTIARGCTYGEALQVADRYNSTHKPGRLSRKAEFTRE
mgnify:CR=1 FL=1